MDSSAHQAVGLEFFHPCLNFPAFLYSHSPGHVEPYHAYFTIFRKQLLQLSLALSIQKPSKYLTRLRIIPSISKGVRILPVQGMAVVHTHFQSGPAHFLRQFPYYIPVGRRHFYDIIITVCTVIHGKSIMMLRGNTHIFHSGCFGKPDVFPGVKFLQRQSLRQLFIPFQRDLLPKLHPFHQCGNHFSLPGAFCHRIDSKMDKHAESSLLPPIHIFHIHPPICTLSLHTPFFSGRASRQLVSVYQKKFIK